MGRAVIGQTIDSVLSQSFEDFEYIIVDDASPDDTAALVKSYKDRRIRLRVNESNRGIAGARNVGLDEARGSFVMMLDHDDLFLPGKIARQVGFMRAHPEVALCAVQHAFLRDGKQLADEGLPADPFLFKWILLTRSPMQTSAICMRRAFLERHELRYRQEWAPGDDLMFYNDIAEHGIIAGLAELLTLYRYHGSNVSITDADSMARRAAAVLSEVYRRRYQLELECEEAAMLVRVVTQKRGARSLQELQRTGSLLSRLFEAFCAQETLSPEQSRIVAADVAARWWRIVERSAKTLGPDALGIFENVPLLCAVRPPFSRRMSAGISSRIGESRLRRIKSLIKSGSK